MLLLDVDRGELGLGHDGRLVQEADGLVNVHIVVILRRGRRGPDLEMGRMKG